MEAIRDYIISHAMDMDPGWRIAIGLFFTAGLILLCLIPWWIARRKYEGRCTARAVGTIVSIKSLDIYTYDRFVIRYRVGEREMTVTDKVLPAGLVPRILFGRDEVDRGKRRGDKVVIFYNPSNPKEHIVVYSGGRYNYRLLSLLGDALLMIIALAVASIYYI